MALIGVPPEPGQIVRVRQRRYLVEEVTTPPSSGDSTLVRLSCLDDDAQGQPLAILWENELDPEVLSGEDWNQIAERGFDPPHLFASYFHTLRWGCVTATNPGLFQSPFRAGIRIDAYQLEPLRKALLLPRVNLFIADDVGLGKTIEAGLIVRELLLRRKVREIVVACPPSMLHQWQDELETRFGLTFEILDKAYLGRVRQERGFGVNPWTTHPRFLVSHRLLIDEEGYAGPLRDWLGELRPGSLLILDEAHHAAPASGAKYAIDSKFTRAIRDLAGRFEHRLFLSATPHNGHSNSFSALLEILDPQRFCRGVPVKGKKLLEDIMVRRLKEDLREVAGGFPKRQPVQEDIDGLPPDAPELRLSMLLDEYRSLRDERLKGLAKQKRAQATILISCLQQRLLSSIEAFARTLRVHRKTVLRQWEGLAAATPPEPERATLVQLDLLAGGISSDDDRATLPEDELQAEEDAQVEAASWATAAPSADAAARQLFAREQKLLDAMTAIAEHSRGLPDAKIQRLIAWIREHLCPGQPPRWNDDRLLIFTEYDDTKRYIREQLEAALPQSDRASGQAGERIDVFHGPTPPAQREELKRAFNADPRKHALRILIATDAAREGLNLQMRCHHLFHFDLPWNPGRIEQRNGRIDRKLQPRPEVFCHYFVYCQRPEDRVLQVLVKKIDRIKKELGSLAPVVEGRLSDSLRHGIRHADAERLARELDGADLEAEEKATVAEELEESRERQGELQSQIERLRDGLEKSKKWMALDEDQFRAAISSSLEILGARPLEALAPEEAGSGSLARFQFPALDQRAGADPSWAEVLDTLRASRERDQKPWEWRRTSPIRPIVFEDSGTMDEGVVHLHLEHRVVQRLLGRFSAQGFVHHDLSRACLAHTKDAIPRVILLGRLSLYGPGAARLHDELVPVTARWLEPSQRKGPLAPYGREAESKTLELLEEALLPRSGRKLDDKILARLQAAAPEDVKQLLEPLEETGRKLAESAQRKLAERGERESKAMRDLLEAQKERIEKTRAAVDKPPRDGTREFDFMKDLNPDERRQLDSNKRHWVKRLAAIDAELETEPARIRHFYEVRAQRLEPVGLVYLWPLSG